MHREIVSDDKFQHRQPEHNHFIFEGMDFPASKQDLVDFITDSEAPQETMNLIRALPDREYMSTDDVWRGMAEAQRVYAQGGRRDGQPRDDIGKESTVLDDGRETHG